MTIFLQFSIQQSLSFVSEVIIRAKWKNLRDLFRKDVKKFKTTSLKNYRGRWRYFQPLWFLYKICDKKFNDESQDDDDDDKNNDEENNDEENHDDEKDGEVDNLSNTEYLEETDQEDCEGNAVEIQNVFQVPCKNVEYLEEDPISERKPYVDDDYDLMFLKSLMPYFRQLDSMRKLVLRSKIQDMLMNEIAAQNSLKKNK